MSGAIRELVAGAAGGDPPNVYAVHLQDEVAAGASSFADRAGWESPVDGWLVSYRAWHVPGSQDALEVKPVIYDRGMNDSRDIPDYGETEGSEEEFITGEPEGDDIPTRRRIEDGQTLMVVARNTNANNAYRFRYNFIVVEGAVL